jgi:hypothetical protein
MPEKLPAERGGIAAAMFCGGERERQTDGLQGYFEGS